MKKNRRRSQGGDLVLDEPIAPAEPDEEPPAAEAPVRGRRRLWRADQADEAEEPEQLPAGTDGGAKLTATDAGRYLKQAARDEAPSRLGSPTGDVDASARRVWQIAFGLMVRRRFEPDAALAEISRTVATAVREHAAAGLAILDAEMLVRAALGEAVPVGDLDEGVLTAVHLLLFASLADELALGDPELDAIIAEAEEKASTLMAV